MVVLFHLMQRRGNRVKYNYHIQRERGYSLFRFRSYLFLFSISKKERGVCGEGVGRGDRQGERVRERCLTKQKGRKQLI